GGLPCRGHRLGRPVSGARPGQPRVRLAAGCTGVGGVSGVRPAHQPRLVRRGPGTGAVRRSWPSRATCTARGAVTGDSGWHLYRYDAVGRLQQANLQRLGQGGPPATDISQFITLGPLGTALVARRRPRVLLIDEFDKSDIDLPNDLLNVLEEGQFAIPELVRE